MGATLLELAVLVTPEPPVATVLIAGASLAAPVTSQLRAASFTLFPVVRVSVAPSDPSAQRQNTCVVSSEASDESLAIELYPVNVTAPGAAAKRTKTISNVPATGEPTLIACDVAADVMSVFMRAESTGAAI